MPVQSVPQNKPLGFSLGRLLGSWLGVILTPLLPMLKWIFAPYFPIASNLAHGVTVSSLSQLQGQLVQLGSGVLMGIILPQLLLCLAVCVGFSWAFGWLGNLMESRLRGHLKSPLVGLAARKEQHRKGTYSST
jgi:hypothetical protein